MPAFVLKTADVEEGMAEYVGTFTWIVIGILGSIAAVFISVKLIYGLLKTVCIRQLEYRRYFSEEGVYEGESLYLIEELQNHSFLPMFGIDLEAHISANVALEGCSRDEKMMQHFISRFTVMPFTTVVRRHRAAAKKRGYYQLETAKIAYAGIDLYLESKAELEVYPKPLEFEQIEQMNRILNYEVPSRIPMLNDAFSFRGIREYSGRESFSDINFKASARAARFMVNEKGYLLGRQLQIYVNFQMPPKSIESAVFSERMEQALSYVAYAVGNGLQKGYQIGLCTNSRMVNGAYYLRFKRQTGSVHYKELLRQLAKVRMMAGKSFASVIDMDVREGITGCEIYILTTYMDESIDEKIGQLERMGNTTRLLLLE